MDCARIRTRLGELERLDPERRVFRFGKRAFGEAIDGALLASIEATLGRELPDAYRRYLCELGNGGPGPYYGIFSLEESLERAWELVLGDPDDERPDTAALRELVPALPALSRDFPLEHDVDFGEVIGRPAWDEHVKRLEEDPAYVAKWEELTARYLSPPYDGGIWPICEYGCGDFFVLVLRGPRRGTVWVNSVHGSTGYYCLEVGFDGFIERWLDDAERRVREQDFAAVNAHYAYLRYGENRRYRPV